MNQIHAIMPGKFNRGLDELGYHMSAIVGTETYNEWWREWSGHVEDVSETYRRIEDRFILANGFYLREYQFTTSLVHCFASRIFLKERFVRRPILAAGAELATRLNADKVLWFEERAITHSPFGVTMDMEFDETFELVQQLSGFIKIDVNDYSAFDRNPARHKRNWWYMIQDVKK